MFCPKARQLLNNELAEGYAPGICARADQASRKWWAALDDSLQHTFGARLLQRAEQISRVEWQVLAAFHGRGAEHDQPFTPVGMSIGVGGLRQAGQKRPCPLGLVNRTKCLRWPDRRRRKRHDLLQDCRGRSRVSGSPRVEPIHTPRRIKVDGLADVES